MSSPDRKEKHSTHGLRNDRTKLPKTEEASQRNITFNKTVIENQITNTTTQGKVPFSDRNTNQTQAGQTRQPIGTGVVQDDHVVISGVSCRLPESNNTDEFWRHLVEGQDMVTEDDRRWPPGLHGLPPRNGKLMDISKFDARYFGVTPKQADTMDPQLRLLLEVAYEAIMDSGSSLSDMQSGSTGVFIGSTFSDGHDLLSADSDAISGYEMTGCNRAMLANRLSYFFDLKGPSMSVDTACSSGLEALCVAMSALRQGRCDRALVGASNLLLKPETSLQFMNLKMLSSDGTCKSFDKSANGYCRSEGIVVMVIERESVAMRNYLTILEAMDGSDGYKQEGISFPSANAQRTLLERVYSRACVEPSDVTFVEAHGTGTAAGDPVELNTIATVLASGRGGKPLLVGSSKSNMGHSEACAGLAALLKVILAHRNRTLPQNLHFIEPNPEIPALKDGRLRVVDKNMPWRGGIVGINSFGFGGANVHLVVKTPELGPIKELQVATKEEKKLPEVVFFAGNTEVTIENVLSLDITRNEPAYMRALCARRAADGIKYQPARGFAIPEALMLETQLNDKTSKRPLWFVYPGMGSQWHGMGRELMIIPKFKEVINTCQETLASEGFDLDTIMHSDDIAIYEDPLNAFVAICAIQIAITSLLFDLELIPDGLVGHSVGELGCAYADGTLSVEQTIRAAYWRGRCIKDSKLPPGAMAAVGLTWEECQTSCPPGVQPACHNATGTVTVSGSKDKIAAFVMTLKAKGTFAKEVNSSGVAFHSDYMKQCAPALKSALQKIIPDPIKRSSKWISSSVPEAEWGSHKALMGSAEYHVNNLISPVLFKEALAHVPTDAIVIEIGPHGLLQSLLKRELGKGIVCLSSMRKLHENNLLFLLLNIGRCYLHGKLPDISKLYGPKPRLSPNVNLPMLSNCVEWNHTETWHVPSYKDVQHKKGTNKGLEIKISLSDEHHAYLADHVIDGRVLYPAAGFVVMAWSALASLKGVQKEALDVTFERFKLHEATILKPDEIYTFRVLISQHSGKFEITEGALLKCSGLIHVADPTKIIQSSNLQYLEPGSGKDSMVLRNVDLYQELRLRGYDYGSNFQSVLQYDVTDAVGKLAFTGNWVSFVDALLHVVILEEHAGERALKLPTRIKQLHVTPSLLKQSASDEIKVAYDRNLKQINSQAAILRQVTFTTSSRSQNSHEPALEKYQFQPNIQWQPGFATFSRKKLDLNQNELKSPNNQIIVPENSYSTFTVSTSQIMTQNNDLADSVPNDMAQSAKFMLDMVIENIYKQRITFGAKIETAEGLQCFEQIFGTSQKYPHVQFEFWIIAHETVVKSDFHNQHEGLIKLVSQEEASDSAIKNTDILFYDTFAINGMLTKLVENAFILLHTSQSQAVSFSQYGHTENTNLNMVSCRNTNQESSLVLLKFNPAKPLLPHVIYVQNTRFDWVEELKETRKLVREKPYDRIWLVVPRNESTGVLGMINCLLQEPNSSQIKCLVNCSVHESYLPEPVLPGNSGFDELVQRDIVMNVYKDGVWGSFRKSQLLQDSFTDTVSDVFLDIPVKGDLTSLTWFEMPPYDFNTPKRDMIDITHSTLNFRDVMIATGRLAVDALPGTNDTPLGLEFAGYNKDGKRMMGINMGKGLASRICCHPLQIWEVPDHWGLSEAATIPIAYVTAYYSLVVRANIQSRQRVLIHSATSAVGLAAVRIADSRGCEVYVTAGTQEKRQYLATDCGVKLDNIGDSRSLSFVNKFLTATHGKGMDVVLNALADEKLMASLDILAENGHFLEIGKYDLSEDTMLGMSVFLKNISFHGIQVEQLFTPNNQELKRVYELMVDGIARGTVVPMKHHLFHHTEVEAAFRYMAEGVHIGKIVIQMRNVKHKLTSSIASSATSFVGTQGYTATRRSYFSSNKVYIITGGLGGLGMEMANWLIQRGARHLILTSRRGVTTGYQAYILQNWTKRGVKVKVSQLDVKVRVEAEKLFQLALTIGPIGGVFHLAAVLRDAHFDSQSASSFQEVCTIKIQGIDNLDELTRALCVSTLDHFVAFSSAAAGFGNAGQTNYAFANSYMERVCEKRVLAGFPGKAIQWGFIGDVGIVQNNLGGNSLFHMGMVPQRIPSFLETLDMFLLGPSNVYSSVVPVPRARHTSRGEKAESSSDVAEEAILAVANIIGVKDAGKVNVSTPLLEMGLDSLMATEIRQVLGRRFDLQLSVAEVQTLTLQTLRDIAGHK